MICQIKSWFPQPSTNIDFLKKLTWKNVAFTWTPDSQALFERLKDHLLQYVPVSPASPEHPFQLYTDGSKTNGIGFILLQEYNGKKQFFQCGSTSLTTTQQNYSIIKIELSAITFALFKLDFYLRYA